MRWPLPPGEGREGRLRAFRRSAPRQAIGDLVQDPDIGGAMVIYGYQEWSSSRTGIYIPQIYVPLVNEVDATAAIVSETNQLGADLFCDAESMT